MLEIDAGGRVGVLAGYLLEGRSSASTADNEGSGAMTASNETDFAGRLFVGVPLTDDARTEIGADARGRAAWGLSAAAPIRTEREA